jgi:hypothetical protein
MRGIWIQITACTDWSNMTANELPAVASVSRIINIFAVLYPN